MIARVLPLLAFIAAANAADLASELALWGPLATDDTGDIDDGLWFAHGAGLWSGHHRARGLADTGRDPGVDGVMVFGYARDEAVIGHYGMSTYSFSRAAIQIGTDPLASESGEPLIAVQGAFGLPVLISAQVQIGWSGERGAVTAGELSFFPIRMRIETDDEVRTVRVGSGPRLLGSTAPWAWGALIDWARTEVDGLPPDEGAILEGYLLYRAANHVLLGLAVTERVHARGAEDATNVTLLMGATF